MYEETGLIKLYFALQFTFTDLQSIEEMERLALENLVSYVISTGFNPYAFAFFATRHPIIAITFLF